MANAMCIRRHMHASGAARVQQDYGRQTRRVGHTRRLRILYGADGGRSDPALAEIQPQINPETAGRV